MQKTLKIPYNFSKFLNKIMIVKIKKEKINFQNLIIILCKTCINAKTYNF